MATDAADGRGTRPEPFGEALRRRDGSQREK